MPPPKDRLAAMQQNAYIEGDDDFEVGMEDQEGPLKDFFKEVEEIRNNCEKVDVKINEVKKLQSEILNSPVVDKKHQQQMDDLMAEIKKLANNVRSRLKKMEQEAETEEKARGQVTGELRIKKTQQMTASRRFVEVMTEYNRIQVTLVL
jgi:t-SNARE complex subunit (syntaxin)